MRELDRLATMFPENTAADFTIGDIQTYLARRTMMPDPETGKRLSQNSRRKVILVLNNFFR
jgi:hypothetical protein